jgi:NifU-like protein
MENTKNSFDSLSTIQKIMAIDKVINEKIRDFLQSDGGDLDFIDLKENKGFSDVYITYMGACGSCSSSGGTLVSIQKILNGQLETNNIRVYTI